MEYYWHTRLYVQYTKNCILQMNFYVKYDKIYTNGFLLPYIKLGKLTKKKKGDGKMKKKKAAALLLAAAMTVGALPGWAVPTVQAAEVSAGDLTDTDTEAPAAWGALPNANQYKYQKDELAAFCHFGMNTYTGSEWGNGKENPSQFALKNDFDAATLVKLIHDAGFKKLIITAKHHDGFCIWPSAYTEHDTETAGYDGDILAEISAECTKYDIDMGLYLSPWDENAPSYGYYDENGNALCGSNGQPLNGMTWEEVYEKDAKDYNEYYDNQLREILGNPKYGNDGTFVEVWMDGAKGGGADAQTYDFQRWFSTIQELQGKAAGKPADCMLFGAEAYTTVRWIGNEDGLANEETWSKSNVNYENNTIDSNKKGSYYIGYEDGNQWTVPECDGRLTSGWFWGNNKKTPKTIEQLATMYFGSVGHNGTMLLNIPPNTEGTIDQAMIERIQEFGENIRQTFDSNMAAGNDVSITASEVRGNDIDFSPANVLDGNDDTYWTTNDGTNTGSITIDLGKTRTFDVVSIEEAIQLGQRIKSFKVEYKNGDGEWKTFQEGTTIGAKRLCRNSSVKADKVRITVATSEAVPILSEVGIYKASDDFALAGGIPDGMVTVDNTDKDTQDGYGFTYSGWTQETGTQYINGTNMWANAGASLKLEFTGTKVYLMGTKDPNHGTADIYIDGDKVATIDTNATARSLGQMIFQSDDLADGKHTLELRVTNKAIGIEAAAVLDNGGKGMFEIENPEYTMNEDSEMQLKIKRIGGSEGEVSVKVNKEPGSAVQGDFDTTVIPDVVFGDGETEKEVTIRTTRNQKVTGDQYFTVTLSDTTNDAVLGFNDSAKIIIKDADSITKEKLQTLTDEVKKLQKDHYVSGWEELQDALAEAESVLAQENPNNTAVINAYTALESAKNALEKRTSYTEEDPLVLPGTKSESVLAEAEFFALDSSDAEAGKEVRIVKSEEDSNGAHVGWFEQGNKIMINYDAPKTGTYNVNMTYVSGRPENNANDIHWTEKDGKIKDGSIEVYRASASDQGTVVQNIDFEIEVTKAGAGTLTLTTNNGGPNLDKFVIEPKELDWDTYKITATAGKGGSISEAGETEVVEGDSKTYTITPDEGYAVKDVLVNGKSVGAVTEYTFENLTANATIEATFELKNYTEANPFAFPEKEGETKTLEAEYAILHNTGENEDWPLEVAKADWASNGKFVNSLNSNDSITYHYSAVAGVYTVKADYRSGDPNNSLAWAEKDGKITEGTVSAGASDSAAATHSVEFEITVNEDGTGEWTFTGPAKKSPQLDKFEITLKEAKEPEQPEEPTEISTAVLEYAISLAGKAQTEDVIPMIVKEFEARLADAEDILAKVKEGDKDVTQEMVDNSWKALIDIMQYLEFKQGDKTDLEKAIDFAESLDMNDYEDNEKMDAFLEALDAAKDVRDDENAMQDEIDEAWKALIKATAELNRKMADMTDLNKVIEWTSALDLNKYLEEGQDEFKAALEAAKSVAGDIFSTQKEVDNAWHALMDAASALSLKPDKSALDELLKTAESYIAKEGEYEAAAFAAFQTAYADATAVFENEQATGDEVRAAEKSLGDAIAKLDSSTGTADEKAEVVANAGASTTNNASDKSDTAKKETAPAAKSAKTGDTVNVVIPSLAALAAAAVALAARRKRR